MAAILVFECYFLIRFVFACYFLIRFIAFRKYVGRNIKLVKKWDIPSVFNSKITNLTTPDSDFLAIDTVHATYKD